MINVNDFKTGVTIELDNGIFQVMEFQHVKPGKGSAFVRTKLRNLRSGSVIDHTFNAGIKVKKAHVEKNKMQFLYADGEEYVFMDVSTYEQLSLQKNQIEYEIKFLKENMDVDITTFNSEILGVSLPEKVTLLIVDCEPGVKGDTATNATKTAVCETGLEVRVPLFINVNEEIIVSSSDGKYVSRK